MVNPKDHMRAITTRNGVRLLDIYMKRPDRKDKRY